MDEDDEDGGDARSMWRADRAEQDDGMLGQRCPDLCTAGQGSGFLCNRWRRLYGFLYCSIGLMLDDCTGRRARRADVQVHEHAAALAPASTQVPILAGH